VGSTPASPLEKLERKPSFSQSICQLGFAVCGLIWLLLLPEYPVVILGPGAAFLKAAPMWHAFYLPIVLLGVAAILRSAITLARPQWGWFAPAAELAQAIFSLLLLNFVLDAAPTSIADGQGFLMLSEAAKHSPQYIRVAAIVNLSILVSLVFGRLGLAIATIVHAWQLLGHLRKRVLDGGPPASIAARKT
jgi:hypothetical protein